MTIKKIFLSTAIVTVSTLVRLIRAEYPPASYPVRTGVVSDEKLGEHGTPIKVSENGIDVFASCKSCIKDFAKDPAKYTKMVEAAAAKAPSH